MTRLVACSAARRWSAVVLVAALWAVGGDATAQTEAPEDGAKSATTGAPAADAVSDAAPEEPETRRPLLPALPEPPNVPSPDALKRAVSAWQAHVSGGTAELKAGRWAAAEKHFRSALVLDPSDPPRLAQLAAALDGAGSRHRATITLRQAASLAFSRKDRAQRWADIARNAEDRGMTTEAIDAWRRVQSLSSEPDPEIDARLEELLKSEPVTLMSPRTLCPTLLDAWGCSPSTRPGEGDLRCECTVERHLRTSAAVDGGMRVVDDFGLSGLDDRVLLAAALLRVRGAGTSLLDAHHLAVETGSGGWQLVGRVVEGWQPGAPYTARDGALAEMAFRDLGDAERHGPSLVVRTVNRYAEASFEREGVLRARFETLFICHAQAGATCVSVITGVHIQMRPFPGFDGTPSDLRWALDARIMRDGTVVMSRREGTVPERLGAVLGSHALVDLAELPESIVTPLR